MVAPWLLAAITVAVGADELLLGRAGESCTAACVQKGVCIPSVDTGGSTEVFEQVGVRCDEASPGSVWSSPEQPGFEAKEDGITGRCLGYIGQPPTLNCTAASPTVQRLCRCGHFTLSNYSESCTEVCLREGRSCLPSVPTGDSMAIFESLGVRCLPSSPNGGKWWALDQPAVQRYNASHSFCLGFKEVPPSIPCWLRHPNVRRVCQCDGDAPRPPMPHMVLGEQRETCSAACTRVGMHCIPSVPTGDTVQAFEALGVSCADRKADNAVWTQPFHPGYTAEAPQASRGECVGYREVPGTVPCTAAHEGVRRLCQCGHFVLSDTQQSCSTACQLQGMVCTPWISTGDSTALFESLGVQCPVNATNGGKWWAPDQPGVVDNQPDPNHGQCLGYKNVPPLLYCNMQHPGVRRLCRCLVPPRPSPTPTSAPSPTPSSTPTLATPVTSTSTAPPPSPTLSLTLPTTAPTPFPSQPTPAPPQPTPLPSLPTPFPSQPTPPPPQPTPLPSLPTPFPTPFPSLPTPSPSIPPTPPISNAPSSLPTPLPTPFPTTPPISNAPPTTVPTTPMLTPLPTSPPASTDTPLVGGYLLSRLLESCTSACRRFGLSCVPSVETGDTTDLFQRLGVSCPPHIPSARNGVWWAPDQPGYVDNPNDVNYRQCLGYKGVPHIVHCEILHSNVRRLCQCRDTATPQPTTAAPRKQDYLLGGHGESCREVCRASSRACSPTMETQEVSGIFATLGKPCSTSGSRERWSRPHHPGFAEDPTTSGHGECVGFKEVPSQVDCDAADPTIRRLCRCEDYRLIFSKKGQSCTAACGELGRECVGDDCNVTRDMLQRVCKCGQAVRDPNAGETQSSSTPPYFLGSPGEACALACSRYGRRCEPAISTGDTVTLFGLLGITCPDTAAGAVWSGDDQPGYHVKHRECIGYKGVPPSVGCGGRREDVRRICHCKPLGDEEPRRGGVFRSAYFTLVVGVLLGLSVLPLVLLVWKRHRSSPDPPSLTVFRG